jgi:hypothetical protein
MITFTKHMNIEIRCIERSQVKQSTSGEDVSINMRVRFNNTLQFDTERHKLPSRLSTGISQSLLGRSEGEINVALGHLLESVLIKGRSPAVAIEGDCCPRELALEHAWLACHLGHRALRFAVV